MPVSFSVTWPIWPVRPVAPRTCTCQPEDTEESERCKRPGKHPKRYGAPPEEWTVEGDGYGVSTGAEDNGGSGVFVVDVDAKGGSRGGFDAWERMAEAGGGLPETLVVRTRGQGAHWYFRHPGFPVSNRKLHPEIDVRGDRRDEDGFAFVVGPGSPGYEIAVDAPIADAPAWLLEMVRVPEGAAHATEVTPVERDDPRWEGRYERGVRAAKEAEPSRADGQASFALMKVARKLVRDYELPLDTCMDILVEHWNPRCTDAEGKSYPWKEEDLYRALDRCATLGTSEPGIADATLEAIDRLKAKLSTPAALRTLVPQASTRRKTKDPAHLYTAKIGDAPTCDAEKASLSTVLAALSRDEAWAGVLQFDRFRERYIAVDPPIALDAEDQEVGLTEADIVAIRHWFESRGLLVSKDLAWDATVSVARTNAFHPVLEFLEGAKAVGVPGTIDLMARKAIGLTRAEDVDKVRKWMIGAVRRVLTPGCQMDSMLVFRGDPGLRKTSFARVLFGAAYLSENLDVVEKAKEVGEVMAGKWCVEVSELKAMRSSGEEALLSFMTRTTDRYRQAYARGNARDFPRTCVLLGTTNEVEILRSASGADRRRFWIVEVPGRIDTATVAELREAAWGEAYLAAEAGEPHWLSEEEEAAHAIAMSEYVEHDAWHATIRKELLGKATTTLEACALAIGKDLASCGTAEKRRITTTLRHLGCTPERTKHSRFWAVPSALASAKPQTPGSHDRN